MPNEVLVLVPTLNRPRMCRRAVDSLLHQDFASWDLVIVKNGGDSAEYGKVFADLLSHPRIRLLVMHEAGLGNALNAGLSLYLAGHQYFANLEDDDEWDPTFLRRMHQEAQKSAADVVHCLQRQKPGQKQSNGGPMDVKMLRHRNWINFPMCLFRSSLVERVGLFCNEAGPATDWDWHLRCTAVGATYRFIHEVLVTHHWHGSNYCLQQQDSQFVKEKLKAGGYG